MTLCPTLTEFANALSQLTPKPASTLRALADADGSLPFALLEGADSVESHQLVTGEQLTVARLREELAASGPFILSCHGDFDEADPWRSRIYCADGELVLGEQLVQNHPVNVDVLVLGVCEAGKSQRSYADEPLGFPSLFLSLGAKRIVAPCWAVEDLSAYLLIRQLLAAYRQGVDVTAALGLASHWLRRLTAVQVLRELDTVTARLDDGGLELPGAIASRLRGRIADYRNWLSAMSPNDYAFDALDWAAFQVFGYMNQET